MTPSSGHPLPAISRRGGFTLTELLVVLAVVALLLAIVVPSVGILRSRARQSQCLANLKQVNHAVLLYADDNHKALPSQSPVGSTGAWWWYKEQVKSYAGLTGPSSGHDKVFGCPADRGYSEGEAPQPFRLSAKFDYGSYVLNAVNLPGVPNLAGREVSSVNDPKKTLLVMEWTAHAPLSWHKSRTGDENSPFYNNAESVVGFVDGHVDLVKIYYDGYNAAYTRDPIPGYGYKYSGD